MDTTAKKAVGFVVAGAALLVVSSFAPSAAAGLVLAALLGAILVKSSEVTNAINSFRSLL